MSKTIQLRRLSLQDQTLTFQLRNDPRVYKWCRQYAPLHWQKHAEWFDWQARDPDTEMFAVLDGREGLVGVCGLTSIDYINSRAEFSLYINPEEQANGYGKAALTELLKFGFNTLGLNRIWGETFDANPAIKMFESPGMEREGTRKEFYFKNGVFIDAHLYSISAAVFLAGQK